MSFSEQTIIVFVCFAEARYVFITESSPILQEVCTPVSYKNCWWSRNGKPMQTSLQTKVATTKAREAKGHMN